MAGTTVFFPIVGAVRHRARDAARHVRPVCRPFARGRVKLVGLLLSFVAIGVIFYLVTTHRDSRNALVPAPDTTLGASPPSDVTSNARAAKGHVERQICLANCASEGKTCSAVASEPAAQSSCAKARASCDALCPP